MVCLEVVFVGQRQTSPVCAVRVIGTVVSLGVMTGRKQSGVSGGLANSDS